MDIVLILIYFGGAAALDRQDVSFWRMMIWPYYVTKRAVTLFHERYDINAKSAPHPENG